MKSISDKIIKVLIIIAVGYLLLQVGRAWGKHEGKQENQAPKTYMEVYQI